MSEVSSKEASSGPAPLLSLSNHYVPSQYNLSLNINHTKPNFSGSLTIDLIPNENFNQEASNFKLTLHANKLVITKAIVGDSKGEYPLAISYDRSNHTVTFKSDSKLDNPSKVTLTYMGQINKTQTYQDRTHGLFKTNYSDSISGKSNNYILATHFQPQSAKLVFPLIEEPNFKVPINLTIETLSKFKVISNSPLISEQIISESPNSEYKFATTPPIASSVFGFVIGDLEYLETQVDQIPVRVYTTIGESSPARYALNLIGKFLPVLQDLLGHKYPLEKLDFVGLPFLSDGAMENWGMVTLIASQLSIEEFSTDEQKYHMQQLVAHELVHQWIGNLVSFDDWTSLWFNEAFATWLGNYVVHVSKINDDDRYNISEVENYDKSLDQDCLILDDKLAIPSLSQYASSLDIGLDASTSTIFETNSYEKGIVLLRMVANILQADYSPTSDLAGENYSQFLAGISKLIETYKYKSIKLFDIWNLLNEFTSVDLPTFVHSWTRNAGYPLVKVSTKNGKLFTEQHIYLYNLTPQQLNLEDTPYHVPLFIKIRDDKDRIKVINIIMSDRSLELDIPVSHLINVNNKRGGYMRTLYSREIVETSIIPQIIENNVSPQDIIAMINDYGKILGTTNSSSEELINIIKIFDSLADLKWKTNYDVLKIVMKYLETINNTLLHFSDYTKFQDWLDKYISKLYNKVGGWNKLTSLTKNYSSVEMEVRNSVLQFGLKNSEFQQLGKKLFKNFLNSGVQKHFTPKELLSSIFNLTIYEANQKEYKKILEFVKNSNVSLLSNTNVSNYELQTIALSSLAFVQNEDLLSKTLNFVLTNIDSKMIELGLIGFQYKTKKQDKLKLFTWYSLHYDQWVKKSLRKGSDWSKQLGITVKNISTMILGDILQHDKELVQAKEKFVSQKKSSLPPHGLIELVEELEDSNYEKEIIASFYSDLVSSL